MKTAMVAGASGLVGSALVRRLAETNEYGQVHILVRKQLDFVHPKLVQHIVDFDQLENLSFDFRADDAFCTLGTTISKAGSKTAFIRVDYDYVCTFAEKAMELGVTGFFVVSSMGANQSSAIFYNKVKGRMEDDLKKIGFPRLGIFRPSLLLGPRKEKRTGEKFAGWLMTSLDFMIPPKYKAIDVEKVAKKMIEVALTEDQGIFILESDKLQ
jgi:uncharacterized protein YbjT (DUF2867 family)